MNIMRVVLSLLVALASLGGIAGQEKEKVFTSDYLPLKVGNKWTYRSGEHEVLVECEQAETQKVKMKGAKGEEEVAITAFRLKSSSNKMTLTETVGVLPDGIYRFAAAGKPIVPPLKLLPIPVDVDQKWEARSVSEKATLSGTFVSKAFQVKVPAGTFVTRSASSVDFRVGPQKMEIEYWFAENVGIVRQRTRIGNGKDIFLELVKFEPAK